MKRLITAVSAALAAFALAGCATNGAAFDPDAYRPFDNPDPLSGIASFEDFEEGLYWKVQDSENDTAFDVDITEDWASEGTYSGAFEFKAPEKIVNDDGSIEENPLGKASYGCSSLLFDDFSGYRYVYFDINNASGGLIDFSFAVEDSGGKLRWSAPVTLGCGFNRNVIVVLEPMRIPDARSVSCIYMGFTHKKAGKVYVDNIRFVK